MSHNSIAPRTRAALIYTILARAHGYSGLYTVKRALEFSPGNKLDQPTCVKEVGESRQIDCDRRCEEARVEQNA